MARRDGVARYDVATADAVALIAAAARPLPAETVPLMDAWRRVLAADLESRSDRPSLDDSALDGFACRADDTRLATPATPVRLRLVGASLAGRPFAGTVAPGEAVRIATGAAVPAGADAVVGVEDASAGTPARAAGAAIAASTSAEATAGATFVTVTAPASVDAVRARARDLARGATYLHSGHLLDAANLGLAAAMGHATLSVARRPRVSVIVTGDELVPPGGTLRDGDVYDANGAALVALLAAAGAELVTLTRVGDDPTVLADAVGRAAASGADLVITSGGVSRGERDAVRDLLLGDGELVFWRVMVRPGGPTMFGRLHDVPVLGLPGNPVSSVVTFLLFARAYLDTAQGLTSPLPYHDRLPAIADAPFAAGAKEVLHRASLSHRGGEARAQPFPDQSSAVLRSLTESGVLVVAPPHSHAPAGATVEVIELARHLT